MTKSEHVVVVGSGPAALVAATELSTRGLPVIVVAPVPTEPWHPVFSAWKHELPDDIPIQQRWAAPSVWTDSGETILNATYVRVDDDRFRRTLLDTAVANDVHMMADRVQHVEHDATGSWVHLHSGHKIRARVVVDASGQDTRLTSRRNPTDPAYQMAWGEEIEVEWHPWDRGEMVLMDWRGPDEADPSFLYVQPLGKHRVFVEETSLCARPGMTLMQLRRRLYTRLARMNIRPLHTHSNERCRIAMGGGIPDLRQRTIGFGAAGGMVHPSTGYQLATSIRLGPVLADAIVERWSLSPHQIAAGAYRQLWPRDVVRTWALLHFGLDVLCDFDRTEISNFFDTFFDLDDSKWQTFLAGTATSPQIASTMMSFFRMTTPVLRRGLAWVGLNQPTHRIMTSLMGA